MKKMSLFVSMLAACAANGASAADAGRYYCDVQEVFARASECQAVAQWQKTKTEELNKLASTEQAKLRGLEQEILSGIVPPEAVAEKTAALELAKRKASLGIEETKLVMEAELQKKMKNLEKEISTVIQDEAKKNGWLEVVNKNEAKPLFSAPELDITPKIITAYNNKARSDAAKAMLRSDTTKAPELQQA